MAEFDMVTLGGVRNDGTPDIGNVKFKFPVPHTSMSISQSLIIDSETDDTKQHTIKRAKGYSDTEISIDIILTDDNANSLPIIQRFDGFDEQYRNKSLTAEQQFEILQTAFRTLGEPISDTGTRAISQKSPTVYSIHSRLTFLTGIRTVLFNGLEVTENPGTTDLDVKINFLEFEHPNVRSSAAKNNTTKNDIDPATGNPTTEASKKHDEETGVSAFEKGRREGRLYWKGEGN